MNTVKNNGSLRAEPIVSVPPADEDQPEGLQFIVQACDGPCLASAAARKRLGVKPGDMLQISNSRGDQVHREVHQIPKQVVTLAKDNWIWLNCNDFRLLCVMPGDEVWVAKSDEWMEYP